MPLLSACCGLFCVFYGKFFQIAARIAPKKRRVSQRTEGEILVIRSQQRANLDSQAISGSAIAPTDAVIGRGRTSNESAGERRRALYPRRPPPSELPLRALPRTSNWKTCKELNSLTSFPTSCLETQTNVLLKHERNRLFLTILNNSKSESAKENVWQRAKEIPRAKNLPVAKTIEEAENFVKIELGAEADYSKAPSGAVANEINEGLCRFFERYGELETLAKVEFYRYLEDDDAQYDPDSTTLRIKNYTKEQFEDTITKQHKKSLECKIYSRSYRSWRRALFWQVLEKETDPNDQIRLDFAA